MKQQTKVNLWEKLPKGIKIDNNTIIDFETFKSYDVQNPYTGVTVTLKPAEFFVYQHLLLLNKSYSNGNYKIAPLFNRCRKWFAKNNPDAYYKLID